MFFSPRFRTISIVSLSVFFLTFFLSPFFVRHNDNAVRGVVLKNGYHSKHIASQDATTMIYQALHFTQNKRLANTWRKRKRSTLSFLNLEKKKLPHLLCFHSEDCEYCNSMEKLLTKLKNEEGVNFLKLEMYENSYNFELLQQLDYDNLCGGLPYYYNLKTHYNICGATTYHNLRNWALDKKCNPNEPPSEEF
ncbi:conserved Plasmodium protein, unknown function [Plasmodium knowlesi strain H]|uniref:Thioredoxin-like protein n=3 Tax=Plasmodium knowlesi TaxID=5850 RepID=A0A5K1U0K3_PLAKH|nr:thioredoxin-like protein, putative [Plasmodium knowlesi strain H]OTN67155.1 Uncharacterized protein PKNOH_S07441500 [Plasmodium knowlesi]CAA9988544.1 thioredoxin-like protein, putative [Plasmodium knowlesi strain H]SBO21329.1 conserved Plasmodium protein, unknown function [Plasmodium knowlesi strain H]SBO21784.1 conserved Plasmodium protein, unknown function [Plasmodium knowlesi strain H]VVS78018.1 thioredoxin-like protein, putative [Plasmodium knowlesi strain H]|eukprot:XP_002259520.1 hypothetical protein, conserved in Plasmodium species [Plasmodium knowlesi strain H]